jgi:hypothetical protein
MAEILSAKLAALDGAAHILAAAHRGFDLAMAVGAFGDLHLAIIIAREAVILQWCLALAARRVYAHAAFFTFVSRHIPNSPYFDVRISVCSLPTKM